MPTALTLSGSIHKGSYNRKLQAIVGRALEARGATVTALDLADFPMPIFNEDLEPDHVPEAAGALARLFGAADIVFIASPEYNSGATPLIVNTIAWLSRQKHGQFRHAVFGLGAVSSGKYGGVVGIAHLRDTLSKLGALIVPTLLGVGPASQAFDEAGELTESGVIKKVEQIAVELTTFRRS